MGCFAVAAGCGGDDSTPVDDAGVGGGDSSSACSRIAVVSGCNTVRQEGQEFELGCSTIVNKTINGRAVCAVSGQCVGTSMPCLDPATVYSCLAPCQPQKDAARGDAGASALGTSCTSNTDCTGGLTCLRPTDNLAPGAGPPNGLCTADCSTAANEALCTKTLGGICVSFSLPATKSFCMESCTQGKASPPESKCHGRPDVVCNGLDTPGLFACIPLCATDSDCGARKCDLATGFCSDVVTPGAPIGSPCTMHSDCAGDFCYPFEFGPDASSTAGVCTAGCRLGNLEGCKFRTSPLDAGPPVGACLLSTSSADDGDAAICAQLCDSIDDCGTVDPRWTCILDSSVRTAFGHGGYCWLGTRPEAGTRDAAARDMAAETSAPETGTPETGAPETGTPEAGSDIAPESGSDAVSPDATDVIAPDVSPD
jgi:hypothetical protein